MMSTTAQRKTGAPTALVSLAVLGVTVVLAGCGGSSAPHAVAPPAQQGQRTPQQSNADVKQARATPTASSGRSARRALTSSKGIAAIAVQKGRSTPAQSQDDLTTEMTTSLNPCKLVSLPEAESITGGAITARTEAPLGPTCIYRGHGSKGEITITIQSGTASQLSHQLNKPQLLTVGNRHGYCGTLGIPMLFVPLTSGQILHITAPCAIAQQFAARALPRLAA